MADISITWKKIARGPPRGKNYADDRIPTIEEIPRMLEYPDRRIKSIIYIMAPSSIRLGAWNYLQWGNIRPIMNNIVRWLKLQKSLLMQMKTRNISHSYQR